MDGRWSSLTIFWDNFAHFWARFGHFHQLLATVEQHLANFGLFLLLTASGHFLPLLAGFGQFLLLLTTSGHFFKKNSKQWSKVAKIWPFLSIFAHVFPIVSNVWRLFAVFFLAAFNHFCHFLSKNAQKWPKVVKKNGQSLPVVPNHAQSFHSCLLGRTSETIPGL